MSPGHATLDNMPRCRTDKQHLTSHGMLPWLSWCCTTFSEF